MVAGDRWKLRERPRLTRGTIDLFRATGVCYGGPGGGSVVVTSMTTVVATTTVSDWVTTFVTTSVTGSICVTTWVSVFSRTCVLTGPATATAMVRVPPGPVMVRRTRTGTRFIVPCFVLVTTKVVVPPGPVTVSVRSVRFARSSGAPRSSPGATA